MPSDLTPPAHGGGPVSDGGQDGRSRVLSIQLSALGIGTYSRAMRAYFATSPLWDLDSVWWDQERKWALRLVRRLLVLDDKRVSSWVRRQNLDFHRLRGDYGPAIEARSLLARRMRGSPYSLLHVHPQSLGYASVALMRRIPTVVQTDMTAVQLSEERTDPRWRWTFAPNFALDRRVFRAARRVIAWSEWAARSVREDYGIAPEKVRVIYPGVDIEKFTACRRERHDEGPVRLLFAGYDFERKGGYDLLNVFQQHFADRAELHLMTTAPIMVDHPRVHIHRDVTAFTPVWHELYASSDVFVMPTYRDSFGMVYLEAMAAGLPVIGSRLSAIPEIISDGKTGFLVNPGQPEELRLALAALIDDPARRREMGQRGRAVVEEKFDAARNFQMVEDVFRDAAGQS